MTNMLQWSTAPCYFITRRILITSYKRHLNEVLSSSKLVQSKGNMSRIAPSDDCDSGAIWSDIQLLKNSDDKLRDVMPAFWMHGVGGVQYERHVYHPATFCNVLCILT